MLKHDPEHVLQRFRHSGRREREGRVSIGWLVVLALLVAGSIVSAATAAGTSSLSRARSATAAYRNVDAAVAAGYGLLTDAAGIACIDNPGVGGMGVHYVKSALVGDAAVNAATPEALVYEPLANRRLRLVAVEYVVLQASWDRTHSSPPELFGHRFELVPAGNRYGLPPFYELHAWVWKHNPSGMFDDWNPGVSCAEPYLAIPPHGRE